MTTPETLEKAFEAVYGKLKNHEVYLTAHDFKADLKSILQIALEVVEREAWQPIETVPENVKLVLKYKDSDECVYPCVVFNDVDEGAQKLVSYPNELHGECDELSDFSHFMHLPQLPKEG
jgi:hypothetical protein